MDGAGEPGVPPLARGADRVRPLGAGCAAAPRIPAGADRWQPAKLAARLQAATTSGRPVVLRVEAQGGHGVGSTRDQESALLADELAFLLHAFGLDDPD